MNSEPIKVGPEDIGKLVILKQTGKRGVILSFTSEHVKVMFNGQKISWEVKHVDLCYEQSHARQ